MWCSVTTKPQNGVLQPLCTQRGVQWLQAVFADVQAKCAETTNLKQWCEWPLWSECTEWPPEDDGQCAVNK